jgi:hypothetical protein
MQALRTLAEQGANANRGIDVRLPTGDLANNAAKSDAAARIRQGLPRG